MKHKSVVLVNPFPYYADGINDATVYPPLGIVYLASVLAEKGVRVKVIDANILKQGNDEVLNQIVDFKADLVGISLSIVTARAGIELCRKIKQKSKLPVILGGPYPSDNSEYVINASEADIIAYGESEQTLVEICMGAPLDEVDGILYRSGGKVKKNRPRALLEDLDSLPFPDYGFLPPLKKYKNRARKTPCGPIMTSRGCPFGCTFCNHNIFGKSFRARSPENVVGEIDSLMEKHGIRQLDVLDDNFTLDMQRANKIFDTLIKDEYGLAVNLTNGVRADRVDRPMVSRMGDAGVFKVNVGVESANKETLDKIHKSLDLESVFDAVAWMREEDIQTVGLFILGFPWETRREVENTIDFAKKLNPSYSSFTILIPYPGTEMYDYLHENGLLDVEGLASGIDTGFFSHKMYHKCEHLSEKEVYVLQKKAYNSFYLRPSKMREMALGIKSPSEMKWVFETGYSILKNIIF